MVFSSYQFCFIFLPLALVSFYCCRAFFHKRVAVTWLLLLSFGFYAYWYPPYLGLLVFSYIINYNGSRLLLRTRSKALLLLLIAFNLGAIGYFKYFNFFLDNVNFLFGLNLANAKIILPLGISFYTFQQIAYIVEVYREGEHSDSFIDYCLFATFFPQLIAGPIVYYKELQPLFEQKRRRLINWAMMNQGFSFFFIGLFKKLIIADNLAYAVDSVFKVCEEGGMVTCAEAWVGALSYSLQLYFDFSGYSDMAIGLGLMFGVRIPLNFYSPYKATSIVEFWRRWHMTMTRFFQTYLYTPLSMFVARRWRWIGFRHLTLIVTMCVIGLWHGAGWTWVLWGAMNGVLLVGNHLFRALRRRLDVPYDPSAGGWTGLPFRIAAWTLTITAVTCCWVMFRAENLSGALNMYQSMFGGSGWTIPADWSRYLGLPLTHLLMRAGISFQGGLPAESITEIQIFSVFFLLLFCALAPNSVQIMRYFCDGRPRGMDWGRANTILADLHRLVWRPSWGTALVLGAMLALAFASLIDDSAKSVFIYFQF